MRDKRVYRIALGGICLALTVALMFGAAVIPTMELTLYAASSLFIAVVVIETGAKGGISLYIAASLLGLLIVPNKLAILLYVCLFGLYGVVKFYIEKITNPIGQILCKVVFFGSIVSVGLVFFRELLFGNIELPDFPVALLIAIAVIFLMLYDFIYTYFINFYIRRWKKIKDPEIKTDNSNKI